MHGQSAAAMCVGWSEGVSVPFVGQLSQQWSRLAPKPASRFWLCPCFVMFFSLPNKPVISSPKETFTHYQQIMWISYCIWGVWVEATLLGILEVVNVVLLPC